MRSDSPFNLSMPTCLHNGPHITEVRHDAQIPKRKALASEPLIQSPAQPLCFLVRHLCGRWQRVPLHDRDVAEREDILHRGYGRAAVRALGGRGAWDELRAEVVVDDQATSLGIAFDDPFFGGGRHGGGVLDRSGGGGIDVHVVEGVLDKGIHHESLVN